jgi:hypothetical protein
VLMPATVEAYFSSAAMSPAVVRSIVPRES